LVIIRGQLIKNGWERNIRRKERRKHYQILYDKWTDCMMNFHWLLHCRPEDSIWTAGQEPRWQGDSRWTAVHATKPWHPSSRWTDKRSHQRGQPLR
jgi:hypothetical protein